VPCDLFTPAGIAAWQQCLNRSTRFADAAAGWSGRFVLIERDGDQRERRTWLVVGDGRCLEARTGTPLDDNSADFVLAASPTTWSDLVAARNTPAGAALVGRLSLVKGDVLALVPHAKAAAELLKAAAEGEV
jgi:putative sterol carrier protein